jgi:hypothetical protein
LDLRLGRIAQLIPVLPSDICRFGT